MKIVSRKEAAAKNLKHYFSGRPCPAGHISKRFVSSGTCFTCAKEQVRKQRSVDPEYFRRRTRAWQKANPERYAKSMLDSSRRTKYGLEPEQVAHMMLKQSGRCATCLKPFEKTPSVDHCHDTGTVRGLLCDPCNRSLGFAKDDPEVLRRMADYVETSGIFPG
jgi:hypothetical protein